MVPKPPPRSSPGRLERSRPQSNSSNNNNTFDHQLPVPKTTITTKPASRAYFKDQAGLSLGSSAADQNGGGCAPKSALAAANIKPLVISNHHHHTRGVGVSGADRIANNQNEISIIPTLSSQLIFSSIITTQTKSPACAHVSRIAASAAASQTSTPSTAPPSSSPPPPPPPPPPPSSKQTTTTITTRTTLFPSPKSTVASVIAGCRTSANDELVAAAADGGDSLDAKSNSGGGGSAAKQQAGGLPPSPNTGPHAVTARLMDMGKKLLDAAREGRTDHVRQLVISSGAPFTSDCLGTTALHLAAQHGHAEIAEILLRGGVNRDARTKLERTALHLAAQGGSLEVVDLLLIHGSDVNARDMLKMTPLHWAVERGHVLVVERLLIGGADISARSKFQLTPIDIAHSSDGYEMMELFKSLTSNSSGNNNSNNNNNSNSNQSSQNNLGSFQNLNDNFSESHEMLDVDYHLTLNDNHATTSRAPILDIDEPCIDLVELEWNSLKFEPDFFLSNNDDDDEDEPKVEYLMKIVEELQKENRQLRQRVEQLSTTGR